ncbi:hypothetical protein IQ249_14460 [Lusitaniella coriacea LEGE 07157]|uniref:Uncharacterized protein n=1 Tax=Lusitaniella coriacea LEGE 07157 TaxID=945747 RepID=A0A8J7E0F1_9CYAN|nr:hypothetical protein [Lusitaniella coriacea]MBE9117101.1 hypothetical protein [Lusitaniella coriacea LEGE 07157]
MKNARFLNTILFTDAYRDRAIKIAETIPAEEVRESAIRAIDRNSANNKQLS